MKVYKNHLLKSLLAFCYGSQNNLVAPHHYDIIHHLTTYKNVLQFGELFN